MKARDYSLDIIRILACLMVVLMHSPHPQGAANSLVVGGISFLTAPSIGLFFMVSGALLLPTNLSVSDFLSKRLKRLAIPTIIWTFVYLALRGTTRNDLFRIILSIPFSPQGHGVLWFMYTLIGFYLVIPIISPWFRSASKREVEIVLILGAVAFCYPLLKLFLMVGHGEVNILYYFGGYGLYFVLGAFLAKYPAAIKTRYALVGFLISVTAAVSCKVFNIKVDFFEVFYYLSIFTVLMCVFWFKIIQSMHTLISKLPSKVLGSIQTLSNISFGIYLMHIAIMRYFVWDLPFVLSIKSSFLQILAIFAITFSLSLLCALSISRLKVGKWIIGYYKH